MPTIKRFSRCKIAMYFDDYPPPHFHVLSTSAEGKYRIDSLTLIVGELDSRDASEALDWASWNRDLLYAKWAELSEEEL